MKKIFVLCLLFPLISWSQSSNVVIYDLFAIQSSKMVLSNQNDSTSAYIQSDSLVTLVFSFNIDSIMNVDSVFIKIGANEGSGATKDYKLEVINIEDNYWLEDSVNSINIYGKIVDVIYDINGIELTSYNNIEVRCRTNSGIYTPLVKFQLYTSI